jgi:hypothetical protein
MGRNSIADKTPMLNDAEENLGSSKVVRPQAGTEGVVIPQTNPDRIIVLAGGSAVAQTTTLTMTASRIIDSADNPIPGFAGPITGIAQFGNGGRFTQVEFDIPVGPFTGAINQASNVIEPADGIITITLPTSALRAYARYDNLLLAPLLGWGASHAELSKVAIVGPGGPVEVTNDTPPPNSIVVPPENVLVKAMAAYFTKPKAKVWKTVNCYVSNEFNPASIQVGRGQGGQDLSTIAGWPGYAWYALPAFTKKVKVQRFPNTSSLAVLLHDGVRPTEYHTIAGGTSSSATDIEVAGTECIIGITSGQDTVTMLKLVCELGI